MINCSNQNRAFKEYRVKSLSYQANSWKYNTETNHIKTWRGENVLLPYETNQNQTTRTSEYECVFMEICLREFTHRIDDFLLTDDE